MKKILIVGSGTMGTEYAKVFREGHQCAFDVAARSRPKLDAFVEKTQAGQGFEWDKLSAAQIAAYDGLVIAVNIENLPAVLVRALEAGAKKILVEKPVALRSKQLVELAALAKSQKAEVSVAVNRRFYAPILELKKILLTEKPSSCHFDFTEWAWRIESLNYPAEVLARWMAANPIHVIDTVHFLFGPLKPREVFLGGQNQIPWHPTAAVFHGLLEGTVPVSYSSDWLAPGRWTIDVNTPEAKYRLAPMEKLQRIKKKTVELEEVPVDYDLDRRFKPGLFQMVAGFLGKDEKLQSFLPDLNEGLEVLRLIEKISGYES